MLFSTFFLFSCILSLPLLCKHNAQIVWFDGPSFLLTGSPAALPACCKLVYQRLPDDAAWQGNLDAICPLDGHRYINSFGHWYGIVCLFRQCVGEGGVFLFFLIQHCFNYVFAGFLIYFSYGIRNSSEADLNRSGTPACTIKGEPMVTEKAAFLRNSQNPDDDLEA